MRTMLFGAAGVLGVNLADRLREISHGGISLDDLSTSHPTTINYLASHKN